LIMHIDGLRICGYVVTLCHLFSCCIAEELTYFGTVLCLVFKQ